ncbi:MAG: hypothetical protein KGR69_06910, partial [Verrucomicrobia bacterium]|nr:hypothetical protein [Verrucomicrobiota bacterium]
RGSGQGQGGENGKSEQLCEKFHELGWVGFRSFWNQTRTTVLSGNEPVAKEKIDSKIRIERRAGLLG